MNKWAFSLPLTLLTFSAPAHATGGLVCKTAGPQPIEVALGFGRVPSAPLFLARLLDNGREIPVNAPQWWMRSSELRLALTSEDALREELVLTAQWNDESRSYDGSLWRAGRKRWVRCREN
jgi:hypothetical protein